VHDTHICNAIIVYTGLHICNALIVYTGLHICNAIIVYTGLHICNAIIVYTGLGFDGRSATCIGSSVHGSTLRKHVVDDLR
jgi:hypothetical protein